MVPILIPLRPTGMRPANRRWPVDLGVNAFLFRQWGVAAGAALRVRKRQGAGPMRRPRGCWLAHRPNQPV
jgi:hypothetical protein